MSLLFETIACIDGRLQNLEWHQARLNRSYKALFGNPSNILLKDILTLPDQAQSGLWKCRVTYDTLLRKVEFEPYIRTKINTLKLVNSDLSYAYKFEDRKAIHTLFQQRGEADDIVIVKDGFITDSSKANILLFDGENWYTPDKPLLPGTMRAYLLDESKIKAKPILKSDLAFYHKIMLISAFSPFDESRALALPQAISS